MLAQVRLLSQCPLCYGHRTKSIRAEKNSFPPNLHPEVMIFNSTWSHLIRCLDCSFAFVQEIPTSPTFFLNRYDNSWFNPEEEVKSFRKTSIFKEVFDILKKQGATAGKFLDVGSFAGKLLYCAREEGYEPEGIEINPKLANFTREKLNFKVYCSEFQSAVLPENYYDVITIIDVLEHLTGPKEVLANLLTSLKKGGILYIKVPHYPMQILKQDIARVLRISDAGVFSNFGHINHFNIKSMRKVLNEIGFSLVQVEIARPEKWSKGRSLWRLRNLIRDVIWMTSSFLYRCTGTCAGLNLIFVAKKR